MVFSHFRRLYVRHPVVANALLYTGLYSAGDVSQQTILRRPRYDWANVSRIGLVGGCFFGPSYHYWYRYLDKMLPGTARRTIVRKLLADQGIAGIIGIAVFYIGESYFFIIPSYN